MSCILLSVHIFYQDVAFCVSLGLLGFPSVDPEPPPGDQTVGSLPASLINLLPESKVTRTIQLQLN